MADQNTRDDWDGHRDGTTAPTPTPQGTFKREGPEPGTGDTGRNVEEMNRKAEEAMLSNVRPDDSKK
jgi:hypothetical protein